jgi:hypothetical protein
MVDYSKVGDGGRRMRETRSSACGITESCSSGGAGSRARAPIAAVYSFHLDGLGFRPHTVCLQTQWNDKDLDALLNESDEDEPVPTRYANHLRSPSVHACWFMSDLCSVAARRARLGAAAPTTGNPVALPR